MILVLITGTCTPLALLVLPPTTGRWLLWVVWSGAAVGIVVRMLWLDAPRWAALGPYLLVGWVALLVLPQVLEYVGGGSFTLILTGGVALLHRQRAGGVSRVTRLPGQGRLCCRGAGAALHLFPPKHGPDGRRDGRW